jgi:Fis family transcriptional regulator
MTSARQKKETANTVIKDGNSVVEKSRTQQQSCARQGYDAAHISQGSGKQSATGNSLVGSHASCKAIGLNARATAIEQCVQAELRVYLDMLDGEDPANLYRMVIRQAECAVIDMVMTECRGNQTRAAEWLGISRGNLRSKLANMIK